jgi:glycosyltransferase involved in cell wall biosynthesis
MPSRTEALAYALIEAGYAGLPVIASHVGGIPEIVRHKESGLLIPPLSPHVLARAIRTLLEEPTTAQAYGNALQKRVAEKFSKEKMIRETFALYAR